MFLAAIFFGWMLHFHPFVVPFFFFFCYSYPKLLHLFVHFYCCSIIHCLDPCVNSICICCLSVFLFTGDTSCPPSSCSSPFSNKRLYFSSCSNCCFVKLIISSIASLYPRLLFEIVLISSVMIPICLFSSCFILFFLSRLSSNDAWGFFSVFSISWNCDCSYFILLSLCVFSHLLFNFVPILIPPCNCLW